MVKGIRKRRALDVAALSEVRRREILEARSRRLAGRGGPETAPRNSESVLVCEVGPDLYGLPLVDVAKVRPLTHWSAAAASHPAVLGIVVVDGRIRPAFDLAALLGAERTSEARTGWLVQLGSPHDAVLRLDRMPVAAEVERLPETDPGRARALGGDHRDKILVMLSASELMAVTPNTPGADAP